MNQFKIGDKLTYDDWGLFLQSFQISDPDPKTNYIDIPGGDGSIDLTEALTGAVVYHDREITASFNTNAPRASWRPLMEDIQNYAHGRKFAITVPDDPDHYYKGRVKIGTLIKHATNATFTLTAKVDPYKYKNDETVIQLTIDSTGTMTTTIPNSRMRVIPTFTFSAQTQIEWKNITISVDAGERTISQILLEQGDNPITFNAAQERRSKLNTKRGCYNV